MLRTTVFYLAFFSITAMFTSCDGSDDDSEDPGNWVRLSDFEGVTRANCVGFAIGDYAYVGLGTYDGDYLNDFYRYDPKNDFWLKVADFPGSGRVSAVSFSADEKGYVGTGYNRNLEVEELSDFWEYDPDADTWTQKADFGGGARYSAVAFSIGSNGYIGTGYNGNYLKDMWKFTPDADSGRWDFVASINTKRENAVAFVIGDKAYVGTGRNNGSYLYDFYSFDPNEGELGKWTNLTKYDDDDDDYSEFVNAMSRYAAVAFSAGGLGYIATGVSDSYSASVFSYDPITNIWSNDINVFEGASRAYSTAFTLNDEGYITLGSNGSREFDDIRVFYPEEEYNEYD